MKTLSKLEILVQTSFLKIKIQSKLKLIKKLKLSGKTKIISFFDHSIGRDGVWNQSDYNKLLNNIDLLFKDIIFK